MVIPAWGVECSTTSSNQSQRAPDASAEAGGPSQDGSDPGFADVVFDGVYDPCSPGLQRCALAQPSVGDPCVPGPLNQACEYGGSDPWPTCNVLLACDFLDHVWKAWSPADVSCAIDASAACPASYPLDGTSCNVPGSHCPYDAGTCACFIGKVEGGFGDVWRCMQNTPACPAPRPHLGSPCSGTDASCDFEEWRGYPWLCGTGGVAYWTRYACECGQWALDVGGCKGFPPVPP